ncbi:hypothetical protein E4T56_gene7265 [Termitomyces sp. T112]|nr:hypothetical protein E4T56_gene7265 [Termitomyces sp. T112]
MKTIVSPLVLFFGFLMPSPKFEVTFSVLRFNIGAKDEHWALLFEPSSIYQKNFEAVFLDGVSPVHDNDPDPMKRLVTPLEGDARTWDAERGEEIDRTFISATDRDTGARYQEITTKLAEMKLKKKPIDRGGNCIDFVEKMLEELDREKKVTERGWRKWKPLMEKNYDEVYDNTWGVELKEAKQKASKGK